MLEIRRALEADAKILAELCKTTFIETFAKNNLKTDIDLYVVIQSKENNQTEENTEDLVCAYEFWV